MTHVCKLFTAAIVCAHRRGKRDIGRSLSALAGWALAVAAVAAGWLGYGWPGLVLAVSVLAFWLLLQFSRSLRVLRTAAGRPVGQVPNAVMLHARLVRGMRLADVLKLTKSLPRKVADESAALPETLAWADEAGDEVLLQLRGGRLVGWELKRAGA